jgi:segregation and condensation protein B
MGDQEQTRREEEAVVALPASRDEGTEPETPVEEPLDAEAALPEERETREFTTEEHAHRRAVFEALLMASDAPLPVGRLLPALEGAAARDIRTYVDDLNEDYSRTGRAFRILEVAGGFQFAVERRFAPFVRKLSRDRAPLRLSQAALETLAVIAFKQPIAKAEIEAIRGVAVDWVIRTLLEHNLVRIAGRSEGVGRPLLYGTTREFLRHFGLRTTADLPKLKELDELLKEREAHVEGRTAEPLPGEVGDRLEAEERPADPGGAGDGGRDDGDGPGDGDRP